MAEIRPVAPGEVPRLESALPRATPGLHRDRWERQERGEAAYLVAWEGGAPVGHVLVAWAGAPEEPVASALPGCPTLEDLAVRPDRRSRGIGSRLLAAAERLAAGRGCPRIGLAVGLGNDRARALYGRCGYVDAGLGPFVVRWPCRDGWGREGWEQEICTYLTKNLCDRDGPKASQNCNAVSPWVGCEIC